MVSVIYSFLVEPKKTKPSLQLHPKKLISLRNQLKYRLKKRSKHG